MREARSPGSLVGAPEQHRAATAVPAHDEARFVNYVHRAYPEHTPDRTDVKKTDRSESES